MNTESLILAFLALMVLAFVYAAKVRQRPDTFAEATQCLTDEIDAMKVAIGLALMPAVQLAVAAIELRAAGFGRARYDESSKGALP